ncbi:MAG: heavy metal-binding domain-containing protein [Firmicutes bacterium]|nr:heavy metal-binding domain-containing protein [Bacillota bacterium]
MILVNTDFITGKNFVMVGFVQGTVLHQTNTGGVAGTHGVTSLKAMGGGGDLLTQMMEQSRTDAAQKLISAAEELGADAVINVEYHSSMVTPSACEIVYTGTAVKFRKVANTGF